jgi:hypothetical protein
MTSVTEDLDLADAHALAHDHETEHAVAAAAEPGGGAVEEIRLGWRATAKNWLVQDSPYIAMLLLAFIGVAFKLPAQYWVILAPIYGVICVVAGWRHFETQSERLQLAYTQALSWIALLFAIYVLYNDVVQGVLNTSATALAVMTLLALGTFVAGMQARVWRICAVGALMLAAVPSMSFLEQSALILALAAMVVVAVGFFTWWVSERRRSRRLATA